MLEVSSVSLLLAIWSFYPVALFSLIHLLYFSAANISDISDWPLPLPFTLSKVISTPIDS